LVANFSWLIPGQIAGMGQPGGAATSTSGLGGDLDQLIAEGIGALVTLTEHPLDGVIVREKGLRYLHLPIMDMTAPSMAQIDEAMEFVDAALSEAIPVALHCRAGLGRTGSLLACHLVRRGESPDEAIAKVRRQRPGSVETLSQETAVSEYACYLEGQIGPRT